jgi:hypothetical protein
MGVWSWFSPCWPRCLAATGRRGSPGRRTALYAAAAGITWALEAAFIKATTDVLTQFGLARMFLRWPVYAMAAGGAVGVLLNQKALHVGAAARLPAHHGDHQPAPQHRAERVAVR